MLKIGQKTMKDGIGLVSLALLLSNIFLMPRLCVFAGKISLDYDCSISGSVPVNHETLPIKNNLTNHVVPELNDNLLSTVPTFSSDISASLQFLGLMDSMLNETEIAPMFADNEVCTACDAAMRGKCEMCQHIRRPDMENLVHINRLLLMAATKGKNGVALDSKPLLESIQEFYQNITGFDIDGLDMDVVLSMRRNSASLYVLLGIALFASLSTFIISIITFRFLQRRKLQLLTSTCHNVAEA